MELHLISLLLLLILFLLLGAGTWIGLALLLTGAAAIGWFTSAPVGKIAVTAIWGDSIDWTLTALPMFLWMGEILFRTRVSEDCSRASRPGSARARAPAAREYPRLRDLRRGIGLLHGDLRHHRQIALPELKRRGYPEPITIGSLAGAGTLGILIPPSIIMIVYAVAAEVSILHLFIAGILPGLLVTALFSGYIMLWALLNPDKVPPEEPAHALRARNCARARTCSRACCSSPA